MEVSVRFVSYYYGTCREGRGDVHETFIATKSSFGGTEFGDNKFPDNKLCFAQNLIITRN